MKINENENISIWLAGNTGLRNPLRIHDGLEVLSKSQFVGELHGKANELGFMKLLNDKNVINNESGKDASGSHARKWRLMFERYGFIYGKVKKSAGYTQDDLGPVDTLTPFGKIFLKAQTMSDIEECFLRSLSVEQYKVAECVGAFSPLRWVLAIMLELERLTGSSELSRIEFCLFVQTTNPSYSLDDVIQNILILRKKRKSATSKRVFDKEQIKLRSRFYDKAVGNFTDYGDMNMRYLRASGVLQRKGRGIQIIGSKHLIVEKLAKTTFSTEPYISHMMELTQGAVLPTDNVNDAISILNNLKGILKQSNIYFDISDMSLNTVSEINMARRKLENILAQTNEELYARKQRDEWKEISDYMTLLIRGGGKIQYDEDNMIEVPKDETPAYLEWIMWRALLAIDHLNNSPSDVRGFKLDADFLPVNAAGGGKGDLYCVFDNYVILTEVTMSTSSRQEAMEGEPVRRHVSDAVINYTKPVYCMFIANKVNMNTAETFRHGVWYTNLIKKQRLNIVPLTLKQFKDYFDYLFNSNQAEPDRIVDLLDTCICKRDAMEAPIWMDYIDKLISEKELINQKSCKFPYGVYFGSRIFDNVDKTTGIVVGMNDDYILVAYENTFEPKIITYDRLAFENNVCKIA